MMAGRANQGETAFDIFSSTWMPIVFAPPALIRCDSVTTLSSSGTQKWTRWISCIVAISA